MRNRIFTKFQSTSYKRLVTSKKFKYFYSAEVQHLNQMIKVAISISTFQLCITWRDAMKQNTASPLWHLCQGYRAWTESGGDIKLRDILQNNWPVILQSIKIIKPKERLLKGTKETWQLNAIFDSELDLFGIKDIILRQLAKSEWVWGLDSSYVSIVISYFSWL